MNTDVTVFLTLAEGVSALRTRLHDFGAAWLRYSSLQGTTMPRRRALPDSPKTAHSGTPNRGIQDDCGRTGRWWISDSGDYCREWRTGPHAGAEMCMEILIHGERMALYVNNEAVVVGELKR
jgi:hypothetical protein